MMWSAIIGVVGVLCAIFIKQVPLRGISPAATPKPAAPIEVEPAQAAESVEFDAAAPTATLTVHNAGPGLLVLAAHGTPVPGASVTMLGRNGREIEVGTADGTGAYVPSPACADAFAVIASAPGYAPHAGLVVPPNGVAQKVVLVPIANSLPLQNVPTVPVVPAS
jgi:hypothetical protein